MVKLIGWIKIRSKNQIKQTSLSGLVLKVDSKFILINYNYEYDKITSNIWFSNPAETFPKCEPDYKNEKHYIKYIMENL